MFKTQAINTLYTNSCILKSYTEVYPGPSLAKK